jgi:2-methylcitrate dehydratase PrpD
MSNAAAAVNLMGLDTDQMQHALGIAEYHAPLTPMVRGLEHPAMVKHSMGWAALNGIMAAELAELGYTSNPSILGFEEYNEWVADIGKTYLIGPVLGYKEIPSCAYAHQPIYAIREMRKTHDIRAEDIEHVRVEIYRNGVLLHSDPPTNTEVAQFSINWPVACELQYREFNPMHQLESAFQDERLLDLLGKIEVVEKDEYTELFNLADLGDPNGSFNARVVVTLQNGTEHQANNTLTTFGRNLSEEQLVNKFRWLVSFVLPEDRIEKLIEIVMNFEQVQNVSELTALVQ